MNDESNAREEMNDDPDEEAAQSEAQHNEAGIQQEDTKLEATEEAAEVVGEEEEMEKNENQDENDKTDQEAKAAFEEQEVDNKSAENTEQQPSIAVNTLETVDQEKENEPKESNETHQCPETKHEIASD